MAKEMKTHPYNIFFVLIVYIYNYLRAACYSKCT